MVKLEEVDGKHSSSDGADTPLDDRTRASHNLRKSIHEELEDRLQQGPRSTPVVAADAVGGAQKQEFSHFQQVAKMPPPSKYPRGRKEEPDRHSYDGDDGDGCSIGRCLAALITWPVVIAASIIIPVFGLTFIVMGIIHVDDCSIEPMIPIWLIVQGFIMLLGIGTGGWAKKTTKNGKVSAPVKILSLVVSLATIAWFIAGNVFVYQAWNKDPDYAHYWFENGCDMALFNLAFYGIIVLDALFIIAAIVSVVAFFLRGCSR